MSLITGRIQRLFLAANGSPTPVFDGGGLMRIFTVAMLVKVRSGTAMGHTYLCLVMMTLCSQML